MTSTFAAAVPRQLGSEAWYRRTPQRHAIRVSLRAPTSSQSPRNSSPQPSRDGRARGPDTVRSNPTLAKRPPRSIIRAEPATYAAEPHRAGHSGARARPANAGRPG